MSREEPTTPQRPLQAPFSDFSARISKVRDLEIRRQEQTIQLPESAQKFLLNFRHQLDEQCVVVLDVEQAQHVSLKAMTMATDRFVLDGGKLPEEGLFDGEVEHQTQQQGHEPRRTARKTAPRDRYSPPQEQKTRAALSVKSRAPQPPPSSSKSSKAESSKAPSSKAPSSKAPSSNASSSPPNDPRPTDKVQETPTRKNQRREKYGLATPAEGSESEPEPESESDTDDKPDVRRLDKITVALNDSDHGVKWCSKLKEAFYMRLHGAAYETNKYDKSFTDDEAVQIANMVFRILGASGATHLQSIITEAAHGPVSILTTSARAREQAEKYSDIPSIAKFFRGVTMAGDLIGTERTAIANTIEIVGALEIRKFFDTMCSKYSEESKGSEYVKTIHGLGKSTGTRNKRGTKKDAAVAVKEFIGSSMAWSRDRVNDYLNTASSYQRIMEAIPAAIFMIDYKSRQEIKTLGSSRISGAMNIWSELDEAGDFLNELADVGELLQEFTKGDEVSFKIKTISGKAGGNLKTLQTLNQQILKAYMGVKA